jgi:hypothetical protein
MISEALLLEGGLRWRRKWTGRREESHDRDGMRHFRLWLRKAWADSPKGREARKAYRASLGWQEGRP